MERGCRTKRLNGTACLAAASIRSSPHLDEKRLQSGNCSPWKRRPPLCHPEHLYLPSASRGRNEHAKVDYGECKCLQMNCHPDRSEPDFLPRCTGENRVCAFPRRKAHEAHRSHQVPQEIRGSVVEGPAVRSASIRLARKPLLFIGSAVGAALTDRPLASCSSCRRWLRAAHQSLPGVNIR